MNKIRQLIAVLLCSLLVNMVFAAQTPDPMPMLKSTTDKLLSNLKANRSKLKQDPTYVYKVVDNILLPKVNVQVMAMSVLGRNAWRKASPKQRKEFADTFTTTVVKTYASALNAYTNEKINFEPIRGGYENKRVLKVNSKVVRDDGPSVPVSYSLILQGNQWKVYDLTVEGISLLQSFRSQFASQLAQGMSIEEIIQHLKKHNAKMNS